MKYKKYTYTVISRPPRRCVGMIKTDDGRILVATEDHIYELREEVVEVVCTNLLRTMMDKGSIYGAHDRAAAREILDGIDKEHQEALNKIALLEAEVEEYHGVMEHNTELKKLAEERRRKP